MVGQPSGRTFISYSRKDGADFARDLRASLEKDNLSFWQDLTALEGGQDWWSQIENALRSKDLQHFVLVVTPKALESGVVKQEIRLARQEGKSVCPVKGPGVVDLNTLPRWLGHVYDLDLKEQRTALVGKLQRDAEPRRVPMMAPELPADFVPRPREFGALKGRLLDPEGDSIAGITAALRGAGGYGKTTIAKALARDPDIQDAFFDGILWAELGEKPDRLIATLSDLVTLLSGERSQLETINAAAAKLGEVLGDRRILLVIDDVWREQDLQPFLQGGRNCVRLVTTRIDSVLPPHAVRQKVDAMQANEALRQISFGLPQDHATRERASLASLAARIGEWPLLLKIVNGFLRNRVGANEPLPVAVAGANKRLDAKGLTAFDARDETERGKAAARTIGVSLDLLAAPERERFGELGVFPEDADIPVGVAASLWAATGGLADFEADDLLGRLFDLSLLLDRDLGQGFFRLHDTVRQFLRDQAGRDRLVAQHKALIAALDGAGEATDERTRRYFFRSLPHHLAEAGARAKLDALLLDPAWLKAKLHATKNPLGLFLDYQQYGAGEGQGLIGRTLRLITGICTRDSSQLLPQLIGRLARFKAAPLPTFVETARALVSGQAIVPLRAGLIPPGAETARLEGHSSAVSALCLLPDGSLASGSWDNTIRLWNVATGAETGRLEGHSGWVRALCLLPDGGLASGSNDKTIRLWNVATGAETGRLEGHSSAVSALCLLPAGGLASGSDDKTIRLWDLATGAETARLEGHSQRVSALWLLPDGRLASGSHDKTIRLWDRATGAENGRLEGHSQTVTALCLLPDGRVASGSWDQTIRLWDLGTGAETASLEGHSSWVNALCLLSEGRLASGSDDSTIRLWNAATGVETARLEGHSNGVNALCLLPDGRLASGSHDNTIRLWNVASGAETACLKGHSNGVNALCLLPDGRLASGSHDQTIRLWNVATGAETARLEGHSDWVFVLCLLPDGRLASGSGDSTIRLWNVATGVETARLEGHSSWVRAVCLLPDGGLASGSNDNTTRLWNVATGAETARLELDAPVRALIAPAPSLIVAGDSFGRLHWLEVRD